MFCDKSNEIIRFSCSGGVFCDKSKEIIRFSCSGGVFCDKGDVLIICMLALLLVFARRVIITLVFVAFVFVAFDVHERTYQLLKSGCQVIG